MTETLLKILTDEIRRLRKEESGVALMLTLSVFLLLYVVCAGVYSIGETVREKIEIQNACDSAAYSAALVQADGLSRMAMINRAMSWTYVQLTNMQIDYITYKWLSLVSKRFQADRDMCAGYNRAEFGGLGFLTSNCRRNSALTQPGTGWFCGVAGYGMDTIRVNSSDVVSKSAVDGIASASAQFEAYATMILDFKKMISVYNLALYDVCTNMQSAVANTAQAVLYANLPREANGRIDRTLARDFLGYRDSTYSFSPYLLTDDGKLLGQGGYFSPLFNTEFDERIFLTMADGRAYGKLTDYFGPSGDEKKPAGGLDQWFIRSYPEESSKNVTSIAPKWNVDKNIGICRVYKNANRMSADGGKKLGAYRAHHLQLGSGDCEPSCINTRNYCPDQCRKVADSIALYAEYEWSSARYDLQCYHIHKIGKNPHVSHFHIYSVDFLESCTAGHQCGCGRSRGSHVRSPEPRDPGNPTAPWYRSCVAKGQRLEVPIVGTQWPPSLGVLYLDCGGALELGRNWKMTEECSVYSNSCNPNGFARIYGDDDAIYNKEYYTGEPAKPWVLNENFYGRDGAIVVGLARKMRNPWTWLLGSVKDVVDSDRTDEPGIYSAFNPAIGGYVTAFSAARAAHRFSGSPSVPGWAANEYETRYDLVCDESKFHMSGMGCVCGNDENRARLGRCWNLCETDWDATLLPVKYAWSLATTDSYDGSASTWNPAEPGVDSAGMNPILVAATEDWIRFYDDDGNRLTKESSGLSRPGSFLQMPSPNVTRWTGRKVQPLPFGNESMMIEDARSVPTGWLDLDSLIMNRVL